MSRRNLALLGLAAGIALVPLLIGAGAFKGSDDQGTSAIAALAPAYRPWFQPLWTPPSPEVESLLFSLQAALGAGLIGYYIGYRRGRHDRRPEAETPDGTTKDQSRAGD